MEIPSYVKNSKISKDAVDNFKVAMDKSDI